MSKLLWNILLAWFSHSILWWRKNLSETIFGMKFQVSFAKIRWNIFLIFFLIVVCNNFSGINMLQIYCYWLYITFWCYQIRNYWLYHVLKNKYIIRIRISTVRCAHGSDQLFPTLLKYVNYEGSWCIETELLFKKMPPYYSSLVIFKKNFFLFQFAKFVKFWKGTSWVRTSSHIGYCNFFSKYNCLVF